jgi:carboxymethylenebutenolidase
VGIPTWTSPGPDLRRVDAQFRVDGSRGDGQSPARVKTDPPLFAIVSFTHRADHMPDEDLLLPDHRAAFGTGVIGVCDVCGKRQAVIILQKERFKLCVIDFLNKAWEKTTAKPGVPLPAYRSERVWFETEVSEAHHAPAVILSPTKVVRRPSVLVAPDVYGITTTILDVAIRLARDGFEVILPDVSRTSGVGFPEHLTTRLGATFGGGVPMQSPRVQRLVQLYRDALTYVRKRPFVDPNKYGLFGAGYGGSLAIGLAAEDVKLAALALAYPAPVRPAKVVTLLTAPVLLVSAGRDSAGGRIRRSFEPLAGSAPGAVTYADFPGVRRYFLNRDLRAYDLSTAEAAWQRIVGFLHEQMIPPPPRPPHLLVQTTPPPFPLPPAPGGSERPSSAPTGSAASPSG